MQREKLRIVSIAGVILGIIFLYGYSLQIEPKRIGLSELGNYEGMYVITRGRVVEVKEGVGSGNSLILSADNETARIFLEDHESDIQVGDLVEVMGYVSSYKDEFTISVSGKGFYRVLERWEEQVLTLPKLSIAPWSYRDLNVNLSCQMRTGVSDRSGYSFFVVEDPHQQDYSLVVFVYDIIIQQLYAGAPVYVNARIEYNPEDLSFHGVMDSHEHHLWLNSTELSV